MPVTFSFFHGGHAKVIDVDDALRRINENSSRRPRVPTQLDDARRYLIDLGFTGVTEDTVWQFLDRLVDEHITAVGARAEVT